jgi:hypothetical protein
MRIWLCILPEKYVHVDAARRTVALCNGLSNKVYIVIYDNDDILNGLLPIVTRRPIPGASPNENEKFFLPWQMSLNANDCIFTVKKFPDFYLNQSVKKGH